MSEQTEVPEAQTALDVEPEVEATADRRRMPKVESRFLYVDLASRRAKQLRLGALPRLTGLAPDPETGVRQTPVHKLERIAMSEVDEGLIIFELPEPKSSAKEAS